MRNGSPRGDRTIWVVLAVLAAWLVLRQAGALRAPFFSDDYIFLDRVQRSTFVSLWSVQKLPFSFYRPWSRELHYWTLLHAFGTSVLPFHLLSFALWLGAMGAYAALVARCAGWATATVAVGGVAALAPWGVLLSWVPGAQDLWMLLCSQLALLAFARRHTGRALVAFAFALLSKETACVVPIVAVGWAWVIDRDPPLRAVRRALPFLAVVALWAAVHPTLAGRFWWHGALSSFPAVHPPAWPVVYRSLLTILNLDLWPHPEPGWARVLLEAAPGALLLAVLVAWGMRRRGPRARRDSAPGPSPGRAAFLGVLWTTLCLPVLLVPPTWQAYYVMFAALGGWLALAAALSRYRPLAVAAIAVFAVLGLARAETPSREWGSEWFQRVGMAFMHQTESYLRRRLPAVPPHTRFYFTSVPRGTVFITGPGDAPALRVWYRDPTVTGDFWSDFRAREAGQPAGPDYFFRFDSLAGWTEVTRGAEDVPAAMAGNPAWAEDHERLGLTLARGGQMAAALEEYAKLQAAFPDSSVYAYDLGVCHSALGDSARAAYWFGRARAGGSRFLAGP